MSTLTDTQVRLIASPKNWMESEAVRQLYATAKLPGMRQVTGFPDLHPGKGSPVGAAFVTENVIHPYLVGNDIGCGMALFETDLPRRKAKLDRWTDKLHDLEHPWDGDVRAWLRTADLGSTRFDASLGTIGGGNHFAELQAVEKIVAAKAFAELGLGKENLFVLVHSGSRGLGELILRNHVQEHADGGLTADSSEAEAYLEAHNQALRWAKLNRALIAHRFCDALGGSSWFAWDGCHNSITRRESHGEVTWLHRKGAAPTDAGFAMIPGSRGTLSYLVKVTGDPATTAWSLSHGAGRKWNRSESRSRVRERYHHTELVQTALGGRVICENRDLLYEEAPDAYKKIEVVIRDLVDAGVISVIATFRPLITYKTRAIKR
jgi:release factor H-coupled RctB family protein